MRPYARANTHGGIAAEENCSIARCEKVSKLFYPRLPRSFDIRLGESL